MGCVSLRVCTLGLRVTGERREEGDRMDLFRCPYCVLDVSIGHLLLDASFTVRRNIPAFLIDHVNCLA